MKNIIALLLIVLTLFFVSACAKNDYSVRFTNNYRELIYNVAIGNARFGNVDTAKTTDYLFLSTKSFRITGTSLSGVQLSTTEAVSGAGKRKWTVTLNANGSTTISEDPI